MMNSILNQPTDSAQDYFKSSDCRPRSLNSTKQKACWVQTTSCYWSGCDKEEVNIQDRQRDRQNEKYFAKFFFANPY